jgi:hypothetical protein
MTRLSILPLLVLTCCYGADDLQGLAQEFWTWRAATQPFSGDDIPVRERQYWFYKSAYPS